MRILILSTKLPWPPKDGGAIATLNMALGLAEAGCEVDLLSFNTKKHYFPPEEIPVSVSEQISIKTVNADTSLKLIPMLINLVFSREPYIAVRFKKRSFRYELEHLLSTRKYDIVQMEGPYLYHYIKAIRNIKHAKVSLRAHNIEHEIWKRKARNESSLLTRLYLSNMSKRLRRLEKDILFLSDFVIPISERDRVFLKKLHSGPAFYTAPTGIKSSDYPFSKHSPDHSIFFLGSLDWLPNQEGLLWYRKYVVPQLEKEGELPLLNYAGRNAPEELVEAMKHPAIIYHGEVEDARQYMSKYGIMAVPLLTGSGIRIKILEGMAMGKCIVTTSVGAEGIEAKEGEHLLIANDAEGFAKHIRELVSDPELRTKIASAARKFIREKFDNLAISAGLREFYKSQK